MIKINESRSVKLTDKEIDGIYWGIDSGKRAGINDAKDVQKALDRSSNGNVNFSNSEIEFLQYYWDKMNGSASYSKFMDEDFKSALWKIFK